MATALSQFGDVQSFGRDTDNLIARTGAAGPITVPIVLSANARDAGNTGLTTTLRRGLLVAPITSSGLYAQFDIAAEDGTEISANVVVLMDNVDVLPELNVASFGGHTGYFYADAVFGNEDSDLVLADVQRLNFVTR